MKDSEATKKTVHVNTEPIRFGRYYLVDRIAKGGMSDIFLAKIVGIEGFQKPVVLKRLLPEFAVKPRFVQRFVNEARTLSQLNHGNIVQIFDMGVTDGEYYIALEYVEGRNVAHLLSKARKMERPPALELSVHIVAEVARALAYAHRKKGVDGEKLMLVHQDVNSFNVMVSYEGEVKIIDFGIARVFLDQSGEQGLPVAGKLLYFSPEQIKGEPIDQRVDIYGIGVLFYELVTGERPFQHQASVGDTIRMILELDVQRTIREHDRIPAAIKPLLAKAMAFNPDDRYASMDEFLLDIRSIIHDIPLEIDPSAFAQYLKTIFRAEANLDKDRLRKLIGWAPPPERTSGPSESSEQSFAEEPKRRGAGVAAVKSAGEGEPAGLTPAMRRRLRGRTFNVSKGRIIFRRGDRGTDLYMIVKGKVGLLLAPSRQKQTLAIVEEGDFFGESALLGMDHRSFDARALTDSTLIRIKKEDFLALVPHDFARDVIMHLVKMSRDTTSLLAGTLFQDPLTRFIYGLMSLHDRNAAQGGSTIDLADLSDLFRVGDSRQVGKYVAKLQALEIVELEDSRVRVKNVEKLEKILELLAGGGKLTLKL
jgi:serine/threonine-protein kinase